MEELLLPFDVAQWVDARAALVLAPHPDDEVFGCGGAIAGHVERGESVSVVILSNGEGQSHSGDDASYVTTRQEESLAAARVLRYGVPAFWGMPDRGIAYGESLVERINAAIRASCADLVYSPSIFEMHPDHRALAMAAVEAVRRVGAGVRLAMYEVGVPLVRVNMLVDISAVNDIKLRAMACFKSQLAVQPYDDHITALNRYRTYTLGRGVRAAEAYFVVESDGLFPGLGDVFEPEYRRQRRLGVAMLPADRPLVSVLVRSMDRLTLEKALDSVALQTYPNVEVVVVNAVGVPHRPLGTRCGRFPLRLVEEGEVLARSRAANIALDHSAGGFLLFLDDDDWLAADHIEKLVHLLLASPGVLAAHTATACVDGAGGRCGPVFERPYRPVFQMMGNFLPIHSVLFRREVLEKGCRFDESLTVYEDWDFWLQVGTFSDIPMAPGVSAYYRLHQSSGVHDETSLSGEHHRRVYRKWYPRWSEEDVVALMCELQLWAQHQNDLDGALAGIEQRDQEIARRDQEMELRDRSIVLLNDEVSRLAEAVRSHEGLVTELRGGLEALYLSTSWRITAPLRWLRQLMR